MNTTGPLQRQAGSFSLYQAFETQVFCFNGCVRDYSKPNPTEAETFCYIKCLKNLERGVKIGTEVLHSISEDKGTKALEAKLNKY